MNTQIWKLVSVVALMIGYADGSFIVPEPQVLNLSRWVSIQADEACSGDCYSGFSNATCVDSRVCHSQNVCNGRIAFPAVEYPLREWPRANNSDGCKVTSTAPTTQPPEGFLNDGYHQTLTVNGSVGELSPCYTRRNDSSQDTFTLVFWLMANCTNCSILELPQAGKQSVHVRVMNGQICVDTECQDQLDISQQWTLVSVRVVKTRLTLYVNDSPFKNRGTTLVDVNSSEIVIGSVETAAVGDVFYLYHVRYYTGALTSREIKFLRTGTRNSTVQFEECQCSVDYLEETDENNCTDGVSFYPRFITTNMFNDVSTTVDGDNSTYWASVNQGNVTLTLHFNTSFQIESTVITFVSVPPTEVSYTLFSGEQQRRQSYFICDSSTCRVNMTTLDSRSTVADMTSYTADKIQIQIHRQVPEEKRSYVIVAIEVTGRCDCGGNSDKCVLNYENLTYSCSCAQETHTMGEHCQSCTPSFFRSLDQFDCPNSCDCSRDGVANSSNQCEETGGRCKCKRNVDGQKCDTCKPLSYKFGGSPSDGCLDCNCYQDGTLTCSGTDGSCVCKANYQTPLCDKCVQFNYGFNNTEGCQPCSCTLAGTVGNNRACNESTGQCSCKPNVQGVRCDSCKPGFYDMETANQQGCKPCDCHRVGTDTSVCDSVSGQCQCRGGRITNKSCTPVITSIDPTYGPLVGGTLVTVSGNLLGNITHNLAVFLNDEPQDLVLVSDTVVIFRTMSYNTTSQLTPQLKLSWKDESSPISAPSTFTYRADPVLDPTRVQNVTTFASGGCHVKVYGRNLESVKYPQLEVAQSSNPMNRTSGICRHITDHVICSIPDLRGLYTSAMDKFQMTAVFDGIRFSEIGNIDVKPDPQLDTVGTIKFQYPFEDTIMLTGKGLSEGCQENEFTVLTGVVSCYIVHLSNTSIECAPAVSRPGGYVYLPIQVSIGNIHAIVGTLQYLELRETTGFIIIISCMTVAVAIAIAVAIFCIFWRRRKAKAAGSPVNSDDKELVSGETSVMNSYSELPETAVESPILTNGHIEPVHKETVFQEPKKGIVNTEAEDSILRDEFLPKVDEGLREDIRKCYVGAGHFVLGRHCAMKGKHAQLIDGSLQKSRAAAVKLTIKSLIHPVPESQLLAWGNQALSECLRLIQCKHPHVLSLLGIGINKERFHILYPGMSQGILKTLVSDASKEFSVRQLITFGQQVAEGITFLASKSITHKDVAARNCILACVYERWSAHLNPHFLGLDEKPITGEHHWVVKVDENSMVKLTDAAFSWDLFADEYVYNEQRERYLPIRWMAPESLMDGYYDMRTDVWSCAVLVWELLTRGCLPYHESTSSTEISNYITQGYILGKPDIINESLYDLLCYCWSQESEHRPSIEEVAKSLKEILETDDDGIYANGAEVAVQNNNQNAMKLRQSPGGRSLYKTNRLSRV